MLGQVNPTPYDLYFPLFGIPVRVTPWFWLVGVLMGFPLASARQFDLLLIWLACLFFSILVHEMGHALAGKMFGWTSDVFLYHFGGVARFFDRPGFSTGRSIVVSFSGPWAGFLLYGLVLGLRLTVLKEEFLVNRHLRFAIIQLEWINLYWGLVNLLPVLPLDGGRISESVFSHFRGRNGEITALWVSTVVGGLVAAVFFYLYSTQQIHSRFAGILFAILAVQNYQQIEQIRNPW